MPANGGTLDLSKYFVFLGATAVLCAVPGPDMVLLLSRSIAKGRRAGLMTALGINAGAYVHLLAAIAGISAVIATSAVAFTLVKWIGVAYLVYLGISILRSKPGALRIDASMDADLSDRRCFWQGFWSDVDLLPEISTALN